MKKYVAILFGFFVEITLAQNLDRYAPRDYSIVPPSPEEITLGITTTISTELQITLSDAAGIIYHLGKVTPAGAEYFEYHISTSGYKNDVYLLAIRSADNQEISRKIYLE